MENRFLITKLREIIKKTNKKKFLLCNDLVNKREILV